MSADDRGQLDPFTPWMGIAGLFIAAIGVALILGTLGVIPATVDAPGIPRVIIVLVLLPFVAIGLFAALSGLAVLVRSQSIPIVALWLGALGVLLFVSSMAVLLTWVALVPAGSTRVSLFGVVVPLSASATRIVDHIVVGGMALFVDGIAIGCFVLLSRAALARWRVSKGR
jgi:hypothetical protein